MVFALVSAFQSSSVIQKWIFAGNALDEFKFTSGFHIGFSINYAVTDLFGFRGELLFSQRGTEYRYNGDSYYWLARNTVDKTLVVGRREVDMNVSQASLGVPIVAYYKVGWFEFSAGVYGSLSMANTGGGSLSMTEVKSVCDGDDVADLDITLQHNYNKDGAGQAGFP